MRNTTLLLLQLADGGAARLEVVLDGGRKSIKLGELRDVHASLLQDFNICRLTIRDLSRNKSVVKITVSFLYSDLAVGTLRFFMA